MPQRYGDDCWFKCCKAQRRGTLNQALVEPETQTVVSFRQWSNRHVRYLSVLDLGDGDGDGDGTLAFTARSCTGDCVDGWTEPLWRTVAFTLDMHSGGGFGAPSDLTEIVSDYSLSHNLVVRRAAAAADGARGGTGDGAGAGGTSFFAVGGQHGGMYWNSHPPELRDGVRLLTADSWDDVIGGARPRPELRAAPARCRAHCREPADA